MAVKTYAQQLEEVQAAIAAVEGGAQGYTITTAVGSRDVKRPDLQWLYPREKWLRSMVARESRGGVRVRYGTPTS